MGNCAHHEHILDRREVSHDVQDKVQVKHSFRSNHDPTALACASAVRRKTSGSSIMRGRIKKYLVEFAQLQCFPLVLEDGQRCREVLPKHIRLDRGAWW